jgi:hypothetical protein
MALKKKNNDLSQLGRWTTKVYFGANEVVKDIYKKLVAQTDWVTSLRVRRHDSSPIK